MGVGSAILILLAISIAWYLGYTAKMTDLVKSKVNLPKDYLVGLNYLINEEPDKAVDIFIKMLEVDSSTVETHLAVGKLFRRRGEVDRAIRIHQNLIARPQLEKTYREQSLYELGEDYLSAGMLDRAERIFLEVIDGTEFTAPALQTLLSIYQQEKSWEKAIDIASRISVSKQKNLHPTIAHYYCELAEAAITKNQTEQAKQLLKQALSQDESCARASLLLAQIDMAAGEYKNALKHLKRIKKQSAEYLSEAIDALASCYESLQKEEKLVSYLMRVLEEYPRIPVVLILSERIRKWKGDKVAANFVADYIRRYPSIRGLHLFIDLYIAQTEGRAREDLLILQGLMSKLLADKPDYQCVSCGFSAKSLHWQCPGCKEWSSIKPLHSLDV